MAKILYFITQSEFGGAQRHVFDLANNLKENFEVAVATGEQKNNGKLAKNLHKNNIKIFTVAKLKRNISPLNDFLAFFEIIKLIKSFQPDIIHLNSSKISILGSLASLCVMRSRLRVIYTVHGWVFNEPLPNLLKWFYIYAEKLTAKFKDKIICVSEYDKKIALKYKIAPENKLAVIHNGVSPINFYSGDEARQILFSKISNFNPPAGGQISNFLIGSIGNLYKTKGYEYFIQAADIVVNQRHLPATFIIIGEGSERKNLENLIKKYNLLNNFILAGLIDGAAKFLPAFDIYICSSVKEGFPYSVLEAMSAGLPVVSTDVGGIPEMIEHEKTGLLVKPADAEALAEKIKTFLENQTLDQEFGRRARAKVQTEFSLEKMVEKTKKMYNQL